MAETLKWFTINDARYYESNAANENDAKFDPASNWTVDTHTSDRNKKETLATYICNRKYWVTIPSWS